LGKGGAGAKGCCQNPQRRRVGSNAEMSMVGKKGGGCGGGGRKKKYWRLPDVFTRLWRENMACCIGAQKLRREFAEEAIRKVGGRHIWEDLDLPAGEVAEGNATNRKY